MSQNERMSESEAAHGRGSYGPASDVVSERKSAVEKEQALLTTEGCSKRKTAHARVSMSWCLILVVCVLATEIKCSVFVTQQLSAALLRVHEGDAKRGAVGELGCPVSRGLALEHRDLGRRLEKGEGRRVETWSSRRDTSNSKKAQRVRW